MKRKSRAAVAALKSFFLNSIFKVCPQKLMEDKIQDFFLRRNANGTQNGSGYFLICRPEIYVSTDYLKTGNLPKCSKKFV